MVHTYGGVKDQVELLCLSYVDAIGGHFFVPRVEWKWLQGHKHIVKSCHLNNKNILGILCLHWRGGCTGDKFKGNRKKNYYMHYHIKK